MFQSDKSLFIRLSDCYASLFSLHCLLLMQYNTSSCPFYVKIMSVSLPNTKKLNLFEWQPFMARRWTSFISNNPNDNRRWLNTGSWGRRSGSTDDHWPLTCAQQSTVPVVIHYSSNWPNIFYYCIKKPARWYQIIDRKIMNYQKAYYCERFYSVYQSQCGF